MPKLKSWIRPLLILAILAIAIFLARAFELSSAIPKLEAWVESLGWTAPIVFIFIYALGVVLAIPGVLLTISAATLFGVVGGIVVASLGSTLGATAAFLIARYGARKPISKWVNQYEKFSKLDAASERHGAIIVFLVRFVPVLPFNIVNYGFGLTRVRLWTYVFWSWLAMFPWTVIYVVLTDTGVQVAAGKSLPWPWIVVGVLLMVIVFFIGRWAKSRLDQWGADA